MVCDYYWLSSGVGWCLSDILLLLLFLSIISCLLKLTVSHRSYFQIPLLHLIRLAIVIGWVLLCRRNFSHVHQFILVRWHAGKASWRSLRLCKHFALLSTCCHSLLILYSWYPLSRSEIWWELLRIFDKFDFVSFATILSRSVLSCRTAKRTGSLIALIAKRHMLVVFVICSFKLLIFVWKLFTATFIENLFEFRFG
jgi:hypothetical protein